MGEENNTNVQNQQTVNNTNQQANETNNSDTVAERVFTQNEVNKISKAEKESGRRAILKELGVEDIKDAKTALEGYKQHLEAQKTEAEKSAEALSAAQAKAQENEQRALIAEYSLRAIAEFNANPASVSDLVAIAMTKVNELNDINAVITAMKNNPAYNGFFTEQKEEKENTDNKTAFNNIFGTGNPVPKNNNEANNGGNVQSLGARLAAARMKK